MPLETVEPIIDTGTQTFPFETGQGWTNPKTVQRRWDFLSATFYGNKGYADGSYLLPHKREDFTSFNMRKIKARQINDARAILNQHVTPIFRAIPERRFSETLGSVDETALNIFLEDCDGAGTPYSVFMKRFARAARIYDSAFVLVDNKPVSNVMTKADLLERGNLPFLFLITPDAINEIVMNEKSEVTYIKWTTTRVNPETVNTAKPEKQELIIEWSSSYICHTIQGKQNEATDNELGYVPVFPLYPEGNDDPVSDPTPYGMAWALASIQYRVFNLASILDEIADSQAYSILVVPSDDQNLTLGVSNALIVDPNVSNMPTFIAPDSGQMTALRELQSSMIEEMYRTGVMPHLRSFQESAESKLLNSARTYEVLLDFKEQVQTIDTRIIDTLGDYLGIDFGYSVSYPQDFGISNIEQVLEVFTTLDSAMTPPPIDVMSELVKRISASVFTGTDDETKALFDELITEHYANVGELRASEPEPISEDE